MWLLKVKYLRWPGLLLWFQKKSSALNRQKSGDSMKKVIFICCYLGELTQDFFFWHFFTLLTQNNKLRDFWYSACFLHSVCRFGHIFRWQWYIQPLLTLLVFQALTTLVTSPGLPGMSVSFLFWGVQNWTQYSNCGLLSAEYFIWFGFLNWFNKRSQIIPIFKWNLTSSAVTKQIERYVCTICPVLSKRSFF